MLRSSDRGHLVQKLTGINEKVILSGGIPDTNGHRVCYTYCQRLIHFWDSTKLYTLT